MLSFGVVERKDAGVSPRDGRGYVSLRGRNEFTRVYRSNRRCEHGEVAVIAAAGRPGPAQVGFVAGRRIGNAVKRNRAKRRLRAAMTRIPLVDDTAYIVVASPSVLDAGFEQLVESLSVAARTSEELS